MGAVADGDAHAVEAQILEVQELGLTARNISLKIRRSRAPESFQRSRRRSPERISAMVPVAVVTDATRTVIGPDDPAAAVRVIIVRVIIIGPIEVPVKAVVPEREPAVAKPAAAENMTGAKPAALKHGAAASEAAAMKGRTATAETSAAMKSRAAAMEAAASTTAMETSAATMAATAMPAADFGRLPLGSIFRRGHSARVDQRQRLRALVSCGRQHQHRGSRKAQATDEAAPGIWNLHHV